MTQSNKSDAEGGTPKETVDLCPECGSRELLTSPFGGCRCGWNGLTGQPRVILNATMYLIAKQAGYTDSEIVKDSWDANGSPV